MELKYMIQNMEKNVLLIVYFVCFLLCIFIKYFCFLNILYNLGTWRADGKERKIKYGMVPYGKNSNGCSLCCIKREDVWNKKINNKKFMFRTLKHRNNIFDLYYNNENNDPNLLSIQKEYGYYPSSDIVCKYIHILFVVTYLYIFIEFNTY